MKKPQRKTRFFHYSTFIEDIYGSVFNKNLVKSGCFQQPRIGSGCTEVLYTDRHPYTVIDVRLTPVAMCTIQADKVIVNNDGTVKLKRDPNGIIVKLSRRGDGTWREVRREIGCVYYIGERHYYIDPDN